MNNATPISANYSIHAFMTEAMKLSGTKLLVYALMYSFSKNGAFSGSRRYIAGATGSTLRTVDRAIDSLLEEGLLLSGTEDGKLTYRADMERADSYLKRHEKALKKARQNGTCQNDISPVSKCRPKVDKMTPNNQEIIKNINNLSSSSSVRTREREEPKYNVKNYGRDGLIALTDEQYDYLCTLIDEELLAAYIRKLELYIMNDSMHPISSHFKTLLRFIEEDFSVPTDKKRR